MGGCLGWGRREGSSSGRRSELGGLALEAVRARLVSDDGSEMLRRTRGFVLAQRHQQQQLLVLRLQTPMRPVSIRFQCRTVISYRFGSAFQRTQLNTVSAQLQPSFHERHLAAALSYAFHRPCNLKVGFDHSYRNMHRQVQFECGRHVW